MRQKAILVSILLLMSPLACAQKSGVVVPTNAKTTREILNVISNVYTSLRLDHIRQQNYIDSNFIHHDTLSTDAGGFETVYLPFKYESANFYIGVQPLGVGIRYAVAPASDSSFTVSTTDESSIATSCFVSYCTIGIKKRGK